MTARQKIEALTNAWYGYLFFGAIVSLWESGLGVFSLLSTAFVFAVSALFVRFFGGRLLAKSSLTRSLLVIASGLFTVLGSIGAAKMGFRFFHSFSFDDLGYAALAAASVSMHVRSLRVLTDASVKSYVGG